MEGKGITTSSWPGKKALGSLFWRQNLGKAGEQSVVNLLRKKGWQVIERNWRAGRYAEIDIIARDSDGTLVFIEVKTRMIADLKSGFISVGFEKLDKRKARKLMGCARLYMAKIMSRDRFQNQGCRFDAFVVYYVNTQQASIESIEPQINHIMGFIN